jgi:transcriptional regulator with XRE-family HTH domain
MTSQDETPSDGARAGWRSGLRLSGLQSMQAAASLDLDAAPDQSWIDQQADADDSGPTPLGVRRRLRALTARSWSPQAIADETGIPAPLISPLLGGIRHDLSPDQRLAIANAYDKIWDHEPPTSTREQREACGLARSLAASRGWAPPQAWDDAQIDQPDGRPSPDWKPRKRTTRRAADIVEDAQFVRDRGGYRDADNTQVAMRLGVSRDQLDQAYCRARRYASRNAIVGIKAEVEPLLDGRASAQAEPREAEP